MSWYVVHSKPRQEQRALENLVRQGFECYLPTVAVERIRQGALSLVVEALFPRYLFIRLHSALGSGKGWGVIRSTQGVSRLVTFGGEAAKAPDNLIESMQSIEAAGATEPQRLFLHGETVQVKGGPFVGLEGVYQMAEGQARAFMLIELIGKQVRLPVKPEELRKLA